jgi:hypothetical protein
VAKLRNGFEIEEEKLIDEERKSQKVRLFLFFSLHL